MEERIEIRKLVSIREALKIIPVSREALYRRIKEGRFPCWRFGKKILVDPDEILSLMRQSCDTDTKD